MIDEPDYEDDYDYEPDSDGYCSRCGGDGWIMTCCDDLCHGAGWCMHGDGNMPCPECNGEGQKSLWPENLPRYAVENGWKPHYPEDPE